LERVIKDGSFRGFLVLEEGSVLALAALTCPALVEEKTHNIILKNSLIILNYIILEILNNYALLGLIY
jgi:hypothetical protein